MKQIKYGKARFFFSSILIYDAGLLWGAFCCCCFVSTPDSERIFKYKKATTTKKIKLQVLIRVVIFNKY